MAAPLEAEEGFADVSKAQDGGLLKKILVEGRGDETPPPGSGVDVHYVGTLHSDGSKFDSSRDRPGSFKFDVGVGQVIKGWDEGICTMKRGEKCILRCRSDYAYGDHGSPPKIPGGATLNFEVELFSWSEKVADACDMKPEERFAHATKMKEQGTEAFKAQDFATAVNRYEDGVEYITFEDDEGLSEAEQSQLSEEGKKLAIALLNNCAMAKLKAGRHESAKFDCTKCLQYDEGNVKAFFRRAQAEFGMGNYSACVEDAAKAKELDPSNAEADQLRKRALDAARKAKQNEKAMCSKMFG